MAKVSLIIPVYNVEKYLEDCLDSVINQTLKDIEIICVNDCSTDGSLEILKKYAQADNRIKIIELEENRGQGYARNIAIDKATGNYIMFLDPDDWLDLKACEIAYKQISHNRNDLVMFSYYEYYENNENIKECNFRIKPFYEYADKTKINPQAIKGRFIITCYTWSQIYSRKFLNENNIRYSNHRLNEDIALYVKSFILSDNISIIDIPLYYYRRREDSSVKNTKLFNDIIDSREAGLKLIKTLSNGGNNIQMYITYSIRTALGYFNSFTKNNPNIEKEFYNKLKKLFKMFENEVHSTPKTLFSKSRYMQYYKILHWNYNFYKFYNSIKKSVFRIEKVGYVKICYIFGIKIKYIACDKKALISCEQQLRYLKAHSDITKLKPATGSLRKLQSDILNLAKVVTAEMEANNIKYFISDGTLIGALRHKGFIPWDDDFDTCMMREDYIKFEKYCKENFIWVDISDMPYPKDHNKFFYKKLDELLKEYPNQIFVLKRPKFIQIFRGTNLEDFAHLDVTPLDFYKDEYSYSEHMKYISSLNKTIKIFKTIKEVEDFFNKERENNSNIVKESNTIYDGIECLIWHNKYSHKFLDASKVLPLKKIKYEDTEFYAPNDPEYFTYATMGNYMLYPSKIGDSHHLSKRLKYFCKEGRE